MLNIKMISLFLNLIFCQAIFAAAPACIDFFKIQQLEQDLEKLNLEKVFRQSLDSRNRWLHAVNNEKLAILESEITQKQTDLAVLLKKAELQAKQWGKRIDEA